MEVPRRSSITVVTQSSEKKFSCTVQETISLLINVFIVLGLNILEKAWWMVGYLRGTRIPAGTRH